MPHKANPFDHGYFREDALRELGFKNVGKNVNISKNCTIVGLHNISLGDNIRIDDHVSIIAHTGSLDLGDHIHIGGGCYLNCAGGVTMSDFSGLSQGVRIYSATDDYSGHALTNPTVPSAFLNIRVAPVRLGRHVIVGSGCVILPGVDIGDGASIGALSLINRSLEEWGVYFGSPAKKLKNRSKDLLDLEKELLARR